MDSRGNARARAILALLAATATIMSALGMSAVPASAVPPQSAVPGVAWAWGANNNGELGTGTNEDSNVPVKVSTSGALAGKSVTQIASRGSTTCVATADGEMFCWGNGQSGQLGNGSSGSGYFESEPVAVDMTGALAGKSIDKIGVGGDAACALTTDGLIFCWGGNMFGQLGTGNQTSTSYPAAADAGPLSGKQFTSLAVGFAYACAVADDGSAYCWGNGIYGQLGNSASSNSEIPVQVTLNSGTFASIATGNFTTCGIRTDNSLLCWGRNGSGEVGDGTTTNRDIPADATTGVLAGQQIAKVQPGDESTCAVTVGGAVACWGKNNNGQLGTGDTNGSVVPVAVSTSGVLSGKSAIGISTTYDGACTVTSDGTAACWGANNGGSLGNGTSDSSLTPVAVTSQTQKFSQIVTNDYTSFAVAPALPTIASVSPTSKISPNEVLTLNGTWLSGSSVTIGGSACTDVVIVSDMQLTCHAPSGVSGTADAAVRTDHGDASLAGAFTFAAAPPNACALTVQGARPAAKKLPLGKRVTLVAGTSTDPGCAVTVRFWSKRSLAVRGDVLPGVIIRSRPSGKITAIARLAGAKAVVRMQARPIAAPYSQDSPAWKRTWKAKN